MPRGLSSLQREILYRAWQQNGSVTFRQVLASYFNLHPPYRRESHGKAQATLSRAVRRLATRGLVERYVHGVKLTDAGVVVARSLLDPLRPGGMARALEWQIDRALKFLDQ